MVGATDTSAAICDAPAVAIAADGSVSAVALGLSALTSLPANVREDGAKVKKLDASENDIRDLSGLECFPKLVTLVLDNNNLTSCAGMPHLPELETLWLNKNAVSDLEALLEVLEQQCPKLKYLSLLGNAVCKNELVGASKEEAERYRLYAVHRLSSLRLLDAMPVSAGERSQAQERGQFLRVSKASSQDVRAAPQEQSKFHKEKGREGQHSTFLSYQSHNYTGKSSEGNRFIRDEML
eukprot:TRINITY_DN3116_c1_g2_i1.p1 TRINITY_DN3116_c1_g2~~TRINITY_DN3116_c1_g2_i1.p1  ORF type:complete len:238 (+),score=80.87 TRINITY_DN3116_c1_g2_i1:95-808(+)